MEELTILKVMAGISFFKVSTACIGLQHDIRKLERRVCKAEKRLSELTETQAAILEWFEN